MVSSEEVAVESKNSGVERKVEAAEVVAALAALADDCTDYTD